MNTYTKMLNNTTTNIIFRKCSKLGKLIISILVFLIFLYLFVASILGTTELLKANNSGCFLNYNYDNVILNIIIIIGLLVILYILSKNFLEKINPKILSIILCVYVLSLGLIWIISVKHIPSTDALAVTSAGSQFAQGDYSVFETSNYYQLYPFQLGYTLLCHIVAIFFKDNYYIALQTINLISIDAIFLAIISIVKILFNNKKLINITILLLFGCIQGIFFSTFMYGNLTGFAFGVWAIYFSIKYIKHDSKLSILICAILLAISIMLKPNDMIILASICIVLLIKFLDTKKLFDIVSIMICFVIGSNLINVVVGTYEHKANVDLGDGMPKTLWVDMGLHKSGVNNGYGWYNGKYGKKIFINNNFDEEKSSEIAKQDIKEQLIYFKDNPSYTNKFFTEKILSQWNEPTYASIWLSQSRKHSGELPSFVKSIYYGNSHKILFFFMNNYQQIIFIFACVSFGILLKKKDASLYIIPLVVLGGFLYHLIFEAKTQYAMTYFMLLIPMASYSLNKILKIDFISKIKSLIKLGVSET